MFRKIRGAFQKMIGGAFLSATLWSGVHAQDIDYPSNFSQAQILRDAGNYDAAIPMLRSLLRDIPNNLSIREELGYALLLDGQLAAAQYQFEILKERSANPEKRALYMAVLRRITAERPIGVSVILSYAPTSNLNQGTDNTTFISNVLGTGIIAPESRRISGWESRVGLNGYVRGNLGSNGRLAFDWRGERRFYSTLYSPETEVEVGLTASQSYQYGDFGTRVFRIDRERERGDYTRTGISLFSSRQITPTQQINGFIQFSDLKSEGSTSSDGLLTQVNLGYTVTPNPALSVRFGLLSEHTNTQLVSQSYASLATTLQASTAFQGGYELSGQAVVGKRQFDSDLGFAREDNFSSLSVTVFNSQYSFSGLVPKLTCTLASTRSNVALFDAQTQTCGIALSRRF
ncbi:surface lipoprotein assembly modifier [Octadecabacter sp. CECT 8868]|uniref:surface lipoprotein assembly modifier n=1 Tax=Octadecabacter algicola TaxID=2909342 RepID=UPI001F1D197A|nr:porin family protein [Octadecabacter algicola]MCF2904254.1 surface lipoprotein assembly modifier [Octadecabacter algicola]